jgi:hypothetical protein
MPSDALPNLSYHEARLIADYLRLYLLQLFMELGPPPEGDLKAIADELSKEWPKFENIQKAMEDALREFVHDLKNMKLEGTFVRDVNIDRFAGILLALDALQRVQLYFSLARYHWRDELSRSDALCKAGLIPKENLAIARLLERFDKQLIELEKAGIKPPSRGP